MHSKATHLLSAVMIVLGIVMLVSTVARGGSVLSYGIILGLLFVAAGAGRIYVQRKLR